MTGCPAKTQISLGICPVWSESSLCAQWVAKDPSFLHADSEDWSDWADAQADLSLRWANMPFCWFCHDVAHINVHVFYLLALCKDSMMILHPGLQKTWVCRNKAFEWKDQCSFSILVCFNPFTFLLQVLRRHLPNMTKLHTCTTFAWRSPVVCWNSLIWQDTWYTYPRKLDNFEKSGSNSLPMWHNFVSKIPWTCLQI